MGFMSDLDLKIREANDIPDDMDTLDYCDANGLDYRNELEKAFRKGAIEDYMRRKGDRNRVCAGQH